MDNRELTLVEHLSELRKRIIICLVSLLITSICAFSFASGVLRLLRLPSKGLIERLVFFSPQEAFLVYVKVAIFSGLVISMPIILYQLWRFISPAIEERLRKYTINFILLSLIAFICGLSFAYFFLLPTALRFLLNFAKDNLEPVISVGKYLSFVLGLILGCGLVFEMPVLSFILSKLGIINPKFLRKKFKYAVILIFIVAAIITPTPDVFNMIILAIPMLFLYELSIWVSNLARKRGI